jgi:hypothetical protein
MIARQGFRCATFWPTTSSRNAAGRCDQGRCAYCAPAVLKRERSQLLSAYRVRRSPPRSSTTVGRQRACQAERASASAFCSSGVCGGAARMTPWPLMLKSVDWLGVRGSPAAMAAALAVAAAAAAFVAFAASSARPWSIDHEACCWADAVEIAAAEISNTPSMVRILQNPRELRWLHWSLLSGER